MPYSTQPTPPGEENREMVRECRAVDEKEREGRRSGMVGDERQGNWGRREERDRERKEGWSEEGKIGMQTVGRARGEGWGEESKREE